MGNLQRRSSGTYAVRLVVPQRLQQAVGKRELIASTGTAQLAIAKLVAAGMLARWRQQFFDLDQLTQAGASMDAESIVRIAEGHPLTAVGEGYLPLVQAAHSFGRRLKTLKGLAPYEFICKPWISEPERFRRDPIHQMPGPNI